MLCGIILDSLQNHYTWQLFCSMLFKHSNGNNDEDFRNDLTFIFFLEKQNDFSKKSLTFLKTAKIVKFVPGCVSISAFTYEFSKRKISEIRFFCADRWLFPRKKNLVFFQNRYTWTSFFEKKFQMVVLLENPQNLIKLGFSENSIFFFLIRPWHFSKPL